MNSELKQMVRTAEPKIKDLRKDELGIYRGGLMLLAGLVQEDFLDLPILPEDRFDTDGLFYTIPYLHSDTLWTVGMERTILVVWKVEDRTSYCPLRISVVYQDENNYGLKHHDQTGAFTKSHHFILKENGKFYTDIPKHKELTLSELVKSLQGRGI